MSIVIRDLNLKSDQNDDFTYRDIDIYQLQGTRRELAVSDFDAIRSSLNNIFLVKRGTRILDPDFGSDLDVFLFEPISENNARQLGESVDALLKQEPRIFTDNIDVVIDKPNNQYIVTITFIVPSMSRQRLTTSIGVNREDGITVE